MLVRGILVVLAIGLAAAGGWYFVQKRNSAEPNQTTVSGGITASIQAEEALPPIDPNMPAFEIVRIDNIGQAVVSGRSVADAKVTVFASGKAIANVEANSRGEWVMVITRPLVAGSQELTVSATGRDGVALAADQVVVINVPKDQQQAAPLAVLQVPGRASRLLQGTDEADPTALALAVVDYHPGGVVISGHGTPGSTVRVYLDNEPLGAARTNAEGVWVLRPEGMLAGAYTMRIDQLGPKGTVRARVELPFERADPELAAESLLGTRKLAVATGSDTWRIARRVTLSGFEYTVVYQANQGQIRDPNLIYPGQIFEQPEVSAKE